jgi:hypothetical protein
VDRAPTHRQRHLRPRLALPDVMAPHPAALPQRALAHRHRPRLPVLLHVRRHHERPAQAPRRCFHPRTVRQWGRPPGHCREGEPRERSSGAHSASHHRTAVGFAFSAVPQLPRPPQLTPCHPRCNPTPLLQPLGAERNRGCCHSVQ